MSSAKEVIVADHLRRLREDPIKTRNKERKRSARTIQYHLRTLRAFFRWALRNRYCHHDPTDGLLSPRALRRQPRVLTRDEARQLLEACKAPTVSQVEQPADGRQPWCQTRPTPNHVFLIVLIGLHTGLRRGSILNLEWRHVDFDNGLIRIPAEEMKKANADHVIPIHSELDEALRALIDEREEIDPKQPVIGVRISQFKTGWYAALHRAKLPHRTFHEVRSR